jgi:hypothetical protein
MIGSLTMGILGITALMVIWILVQNLWREAFADQINEEDVLALRSRCGNCGCVEVCENNN